MTRNNHAAVRIGKEVGIAALLFSVLFVLTLFKPEAAESQGSPGPLTGYAWSDTIGWISLDGSGYGFTLASDGSLTGYAWSDNIGWISANASDLVGCPASPCTAKIQNGAFSGWLKALSGGTAQSGGWDGFISLSGSGYGVTKTASAVNGYAWGDVNVGWIDFDAATNFEECALTQGYFCSDGNMVSNHRDAQCVVTEDICTSHGAGWFCGDTGVCVAPPAPSCASDGCLSISPKMIAPGATVQVSWDINDAISCTVAEDNSEIDDAWSGISSAEASCTAHAGANCVSSAITQATTYTLNCTGDGGAMVPQMETVSINPQWREI